jgi:hypothetical protein
MREDVMSERVMVERGCFLADFAGRVTLCAVFLWDPRPSGNSVTLFMASTPPINANRKNLLPHRN